MKMIKRRLCILVMAILQIENYFCKLACKNEMNKDVDWFIALKLPRSYRFAYLSSDSTNQKWTFSKHDLSDSNNLIALTIKQTFSTNQSPFYAYYNDQIIRNENSYLSRGHLKGVLSFNTINGFWLIHSIPNFPQYREYHYSHSHFQMGQSFFCVSLHFRNLDNIVSQLLMMQATVYSYGISNFPQSENLKLFVQNKKPLSNDRFRVIQMNTLGNLQLLHFGKSRQIFKDFYKDLVASYLRTSLAVETWIRGREIDSFCNGPYKVYNVKRVKIMGIEFKQTQDHSKWAVSTSYNKPYVCIGDINRMTSQFYRGGGTLCINNLNIWKTFIPIAYKLEECVVYDIN